MRRNSRRGNPEELDTEPEDSKLESARFLFWSGLRGCIRASISHARTPAMDLIGDNVGPLAGRLARMDPPVALSVIRTWRALPGLHVNLRIMSAVADVGTAMTQVCQSRREVHSRFPDVCL